MVLLRDKGLVLSAATRVLRLFRRIGSGTGGMQGPSSGPRSSYRRSVWPSSRSGAMDRQFLYLASHWGAIALNSAAMHYTWGTWWCVPLFLLQGLLINFLYAPEHECDHFTAFRTRWLNEAVAFVCGFLIFNANSDHRWSHYTHHRNTQNWDRDTELARGPDSNDEGIPALPVRHDADTPQGPPHLPARSRSGR